MRIYIAGIYHGGRGSVNTQSENLKVTMDLKYPWLLESYHYVGKKPSLLNAMRDRQDTMFLDSGAFSAFTLGATIDLDQYAKFIKDNPDIIHQAASVDVIGAGKEQQSYDNLKYLERLGVQVLPTHHARDADHWLQRFLDEGYTHLCLGGMVPESTQYLREWLDKMWGRYLTNPDGTAKIKVHGFGLTTLELMFRYPWYSVDSTSWVMASRMGLIYVDLPRPDGSIRDFKVDVSERSAKTRQIDQHFDTFPPPIKEAITKRIIELGYDPKLLRTHYGWRDHFNIEYFRRAMDRRVDRFKPEQVTLF
jgi:hypothetical protein